MVVTQSSQVRRIAGGTTGRTDSQRRRLQRFLAKEHDLAKFFAVWTSSVFKALQQQEIVLAVDETKLKSRFGVMTVGIVYEGRCIPVAWEVYVANSKVHYPKEGQVGMILRLLKAIQAGLPQTTPVLVLADRGIGTSPDLMRGIMALN